MREIFDADNIRVAVNAGYPGLAVETGTDLLYVNEEAFPRAAFQILIAVAFQAVVIAGPGE
jgi:hypothetical protein